MSEPEVRPPPKFLPWLRTGLASQITAVAEQGLAPADTATLDVAVTLHSAGPDGGTSDRVPGPPIRLRAPGEVVGIDETLVVRHDPVPGTQDAEGAYFTLVEFGPPDLPWRFTPAKAAEDRLQPWIALVVVELRDGVRLDDPGGTRLPVLTVDDAGRELPDLRQSWAWAHVQAVHDLADGVDAALAEEPAAFRSRLMCPRRLTPDRPWLACVVPTFESGRLAGLGEGFASGLGPAWGASGAVRLPVYHSWRFRTGARGDFESLVRRLTPRELGPDVGLRDLDLSTPGGGLPKVPGTIVSYAGALLSPAAAPRAWPRQHRTATKAALREALNRELGAAGTADPYDALDDDPVIGPTVYGGAQAHRSRIPSEGQPPAWLEQLNTEPPRRSVAGLGAEVVRRDQEALMAAAWRGAGSLREANRLLGHGRLAWEVATAVASRVAALSDESLVQIAGPAMHRLPHSSGNTMSWAVAVSPLPGGLVSGAFRRITRTTRGLATRTVDGGLARPTAAITAAALDDPVRLVAAWADLLPPAGADLQAERASTPAARKAAKGPRTGRRLIDAPRDYVLEQPARPADQVLHYGGTMTLSGDIAAGVRRALDPAGTVARMVEARVSGLAPDRSHAVPAALPAAPLFTTPMYRRLRDLSVEHLVPGIGDVPDDTLGLLTTNRPFVEEFLVGLNTELGRELRWREYPARLDGTWFRQFWDAVGADAPDIVPIGAWSAAALGEHGPAGTPRATLVLLIKGALPRRYPDLRVYAVEARWKGGVRREDPAGEVRLPVMAGRLGDSAFFHGFLLDEDEARGSTRRSEHPGWFFVLEQEPGAARFGLDVAQDRFRGTVPRRWSDLSWAHLVTENEPLPDFVDTGGPPWLLDVTLTGNGGRDEWAQDAAAMARITLQRPVRMLVHAGSMLPGPA